MRSFVRTSLIAAVASFAPAAAFADTLGVANDYNVFVLNNITKSNVDVQGKVAVGGNANFNNYSVGTNLGASTTNLVVNGNLTKTGGGTFNGTVIVNGNANISTPTITGKLDVNGTTYINPSGGGSVTGGVVHNSTYTAPSYFSNSTGYTALPFSFADAASYLTSSSTYWGSLATTGTVANPYNNVSLTGTSATLNVFNLTTAMLAAATGLNISAPAGSTVLVNVLGSSASLSNFGISLSGVDKQHILYNFPTATTVNVASVGVLGSILAPRADVDFRYGNIDGTLIANNLTGTGEEHYFLFGGNLPSSGPSATPAVSSVPTPTSATAGLTLLSLVALRRRHRLAHQSA